MIFGCTVFHLPSQPSPQGAQLLKTKFCYCSNYLQVTETWPILSSIIHRTLYVVKCLAQSQMTMQLANLWINSFPFELLICGHTRYIQCILIATDLTCHVILRQSRMEFTAAFIFLYHSIKFVSTGMVQNLPTLHCFMLKMDDVNLKSESAWMTHIMHSTHIYLISIMCQSLCWGKQGKNRCHSYSHGV